MPSHEPLWLVNWKPRKCLPHGRTVTTETITLGEAAAGYYETTVPQDSAGRLPRSAAMLLG